MGSLERLDRGCGDFSKGYNTPKSTIQKLVSINRFSFPDQIRLCNPGQTFNLLSKHREKTYALKAKFQILSMPALSGFTLSLIVDGYHVILMADFPGSVLLVSAECSLHGKKEHSDSMTNKRYFPKKYTYFLSLV